MIRRIAPLRDFLNRESTSGLLIILASALGLITANSGFSSQYFSTLDTHLSFGSGLFLLDLSILKIINYGLMSIFFFVVGLEIKRELTTGHLATLRKALLPFVAAIGGMLIPALIYLAIAGGEAPGGWGVPVATDIALAVGLLTMIGTSVAPSLRAFLLALAVIDDIGAILIIAFVYSVGIKFSWLGAGVICLVLIFTMKSIKINYALAYVPFAFTLWFCFYKAGIHPTLAGVLLGIMTPNIPRRQSGMTDTEDGSVSIIEYLEDKFHPISTFLVVPLFAFVNTGVVITSETIQKAAASLIAWGIFFGLVIGKPLGIFCASLLSRKLKIAEFPDGTGNSSIVATGSAAGIGFTVAIFIANLAFRNSPVKDIAVLAVIVASIVSALVSLALFKLLSKRK